MDTYISQFPLGNVLLAALFVGGALWVVVWRLRGRTASWPRVLATIAAFGYLVVLCAVFLFPPINPLAFEGNREPILLTTVLQTDLFHTIKSTSLSVSLLMASAFVPLPAVLCVILQSAKWASILSICIACLIEPAQLLIDCVTRFPRYVVDIDDAFLMIVGVTIGLAGLLLVRWARRSGRQCDRIISDVKDF